MRLTLYWWMKAIERQQKIEIPSKNPSKAGLKPIFCIVADSLIYGKSWSTLICTPSPHFFDINFHLFILFCAYKWKWFWKIEKLVVVLRLPGVLWVHWFIFLDEWDCLSLFMWGGHCPIYKLFGFCVCYQLIWILWGDGGSTTVTLFE